MSLIDFTAQPEANPLEVVERDFVQEFVPAYEYIFARDPEEYATMKAHSAAHRRVFSRRNQAIPLIGREGGFLQVLPRSGRILPLPASQTHLSCIAPNRNR